KEIIRYKRIETCLEIVTHFIGKQDDPGRKLAIQSGIIRAILDLFDKTPLNSISIVHTWAFFVFTFPTSDVVKTHILEKFTSVGLLDILEHSDITIIHRILIAINDILLAGTNCTPDQQPHPNFQVVNTVGGIQIMYNLFKKNLSEYSRDNSAFCIAQLYRAQSIPDPLMRSDVIGYLKSAINGVHEPMKIAATWALRFLASNEINRTEIEKDGFKVPE
ncbi:MAG: hypothetical protein EZS28_048346, partial [Streblomastix strix]